LIPKDILGCSRFGFIYVPRLPAPRYPRGASLSHLSAQHCRSPTPPQGPESPLS